MKIFDKFVGFLGHHAQDIAKVATFLESLLGKIAVDPADRAGMLDGVEALKNSVANIENSLPGLRELIDTTSHIDYAEVARNLPSDAIEAAALALGFVKTTDAQRMIDAAVANAIAALPKAAPLPASEG